MIDDGEKNLPIGTVETVMIDLEGTKRLFHAQEIRCLFFCT